MESMAVAPGFARAIAGTVPVFAAFLVPHILAGLTAISSGALVMVSRKGTERSLGSAISNGPASLSVHAVTGLLLGLGALGVAAQSILVRHRGPDRRVRHRPARDDLRLGSRNRLHEHRADSASMAMSVLTGIAMPCYAANLYLLRPGIRRG